MIKNWKCFNESKNINHFLQLKEVIEDIKDILVDLDDNDINYRIYPDNDINVKELSIRLRGLYDGGNIDSNFFIEIKLEENKLNFEDLKTSWFYYTLKHLENYIKSLDIYYKRKLKTQYFINYIDHEKENVKEFNSIEDIDLKFTKESNIDLYKLYILFN